MTGIRKWERLSLVPLLMLSTSGCESRPECEPGSPGIEAVSPDDQHIARIHESFCGTFGGASHGWSIGIRNVSEDFENEEVVFITFNDKPDMKWLDNGQLQIEVNGINTINRSKHSAEGVSIRYVLNIALTETFIRAQLLKEQQRNTTLFPKEATEMNKGAERQYNNFLNWAATNANLPSSSH